jgi:drug/metabolite transporter (DMT)-like permease
MDAPPHSRTLGRPATRGGVVSALLAAVAFGACAPAGKRIFEGVDPMLAGAWTNLAAAAAVGLALLVRPGPREDRLAGADFAWVGVAALAGSLVAPWAFFVGLARTEAHVASALLYLEVPMTAGIATLVLGERLGLRGSTGVALVTGGGVACALLAGGGGAGDATGTEGALWIALACLVWAIDTNCLRRVAHRDALRATRAKCALGGAVGLAVAWATGAPPSSLGRDPALYGALYGAIGVGFSVALFVTALRRIGAARGGAIFGTHPLVGVAVSVVFLDERPSPWVLAAAAVMAVGVLLVSSDAGKAREGAEARRTA